MYITEGRLRLTWPLSNAMTSLLSHSAQLMEYNALCILMFLVLYGCTIALKRKCAVELLPMPVSTRPHVPCQHANRVHQPRPHPIWGHEREVYANQPGRAYRRWAQALGLTYRIKAALGVRRLSSYTSDSWGSHIIGP